MIQINNSYITEDINNILIELRKQLDLKGIKLFSKIIVSGDNIQTNCPFHNGGQERKPSFGILSKIFIKLGSCKNVMFPRRHITILF